MAKRAFAQSAWQRTDFSNIEKISIDKERDKSGASGLASGGWVINEILADPDATAGDANGDGTVDSSDDEFVEILNLSGASVDLGGWTLSDGVGVRHTFEAGTLVPDSGSIVIFGGGVPAGSFGGSLVQVSSTGRLGLNNTGDDLTLSDSAAVHASASYGAEGGQNESLTRDPDLSGAFVKHSAATAAAGAIFSPGTKNDGSRFSGNPVFFPTKLQIVVNQGRDPYADKWFSVVVSALDSAGRAQPVQEETGIQLSLTSGSPEKLSGALSATIARDASSVTISGLAYAEVENNLALLVSRTSGDLLLSASASFNVQTRPNKPLAGELIISEFMANPNFTSDALGEYIELYNPTDSTFNLEGYLIKDDGSDAHTIANNGTLSISPHGFLLFAKSSDPLGDGSLVPDYVFTNVTIGNGADEIVLVEPDSLGGGEIARVDYTDGDVFGAGVALELANLALGYDGLLSQSDFVAATHTLSNTNTDKGSPCFYGEAAAQTLANGDSAKVGVGLVDESLPLLAIYDDADATPTLMNSYKIFSDSLHHALGAQDRALLGFVQLSGTPDSATIEMFYTDAQLARAGFSHTAEFELQLAAWNGVSWRKYPRAASSDTSLNKVVAEHVQSFSDWVIVGGFEDSPLPVELQRFTGTVASSGVLLKWQTASEAGNEGFILYRDGVEIASYKNIDALKGQGTTSLATNYNFTDTQIHLGETYNYTIVSVDISGERHEYSQTVSIEITQVVAAEPETKAYEYALEQNYPNPFNPSTLIRFSLPQAGTATLKIFDQLGRRIKTEQIQASAGWHVYRFDASMLASGVYFYQIRVGSFLETKKMLLLK
ncbi:lamin tail domain-containing protein [Chloroherpeton thalassium]|uniref:lamin tail domain-containing protein n=1 Tax=Chloroherpeton thalassium TaxID=100716 RepID=UPI00145C6F33|nr:lamin tail domain-containing protein [Chloroherpeton thalassium]